MRQTRKNHTLNKDIFREPDIPAHEEKILQTIQTSMQKLEAAQNEESMEIWEFLYLQHRFIKKHWWILQAVLLMCLYWCVQHLGEAALIRQVLGVGAPLFVVLVIPELWKNSTSNAVDIEATTMYTLQQVYSARLMLFAGVANVFLPGYNSIQHTDPLGISYPIRCSSECDLLYLLNLSVLPKSGKSKFLLDVVPYFCHAVERCCSKRSIISGNHSSNLGGNACAFLCIHGLLRIPRSA